MYIISVCKRNYQLKDCLSNLQFLLICIICALRDNKHVHSLFVIVRNAY